MAADGHVKLAASLLHLKLWKSGQASYDGASLSPAAISANTNQKLEHVNHLSFFVAVVQKSV